MAKADRAPRVLLVENEERMILVVQLRLEAQVVVVPAMRIEDARAYLGQLDQFDAIVVDGDLGRGPAEVVAFVQEVKPTFRKPLVAYSSNWNSSALLMRAGCTYEVPDKANLPRFLLKLFSLPG